MPGLNDELKERRLREAMAKSQSGVRPEVDWSVFDQFSEQTCTCGCGTEFRSHVKYVGKLGKLISRKPCPNCGTYDNLWKASSDPEIFEIGR